MKNNIPAEMTSCKRWCCWRAIPNDKGEIQKVPWRMDGIGRLTWGNPANLVSFEEARKAFMAGADLPEHKGLHFAGIGYILPEGDTSSRLVCIDLDKCILEDGSLTPGARGLVEKFGGYVEKSPSEKGLHIWVKAILPAEFKNINKREGNEPLYIDGQKVEVFIRKHFITVTNDVFREGEPEDRTAEILSLYAMKKEAKKEVAPPTNAKDDKIKHYCEKALENASREFVCAPEGNRNNALNDAAYSLGKYVGAGWLSRYQVESELLRAAKANDLSESEALATINSGLEAGIHEPKTPNLEDPIAPDEHKAAVTLGANHMTNIEDTLTALYRANDPPRIMQRSGDLVRVREIGDNKYKIEDITDYALRNEMSRAATFEKYAGEKSGYVECMPPLDLARSILALGEWDFPTVDNLVTAPVIRPDGSLLLSPGYDVATRLYYAPDTKLIIPEIVLTQEAAKEQAKYFMEEVLHDFPFVDVASRVNALAAFLSPIVRPLIAGCAPMCLVDKPAPGTGASKLLDLISIITTGQAMAALSPPEDEDEWRKLITGVMRDGSTLICLDNISADLKAATLARALSSSIWKDRTLGKPDATEYPQRACWYATGNNLTLSGDIPRRSYLTQLDAKMARPWERKSFRHADINKWVRENRGNLLAALLTMAGAWVFAGKPEGNGRSIGGFDEWAEVLEGILSFAGISGFLENLDKLYDDVDVGNDEWADFFAIWAEIHNKAVSTSIIVMEMESRESELSRNVPSDLAEKIKYGGPGVGKKVGIFLRKKLNVRYRDGLMLTQEVDKKSKSKLWKVVKATDESLS